MKYAKYRGTVKKRGSRVLTRDLSAEIAKNPRFSEIFYFSQIFWRKIFFDKKFFFKKIIFFEKIF